MSELLLALDFLPALFFILLGRSLHHPLGTRVAKESIITLLTALIFAPMAYMLLAIPVQGILCCVLMLIHFFLITRLLYSEYREKNKSVL